jgi:hypothetical protein
MIIENIQYWLCTGVILQQSMIISGHFSHSVFMAFFVALCLAELSVEEMKDCGRRYGAVTLVECLASLQLLIQNTDGGDVETLLPPCLTGHSPTINATIRHVAEALKECGCRSSGPCTSLYTECKTKFSEYVSTLNLVPVLDDMFGRPVVVLPVTFERTKTPSETMVAVIERLGEERVDDWRKSSWWNLVEQLVSAGTGSLDVNLFIHFEGCHVLSARELECLREGMLRVTLKTQRRPGRRGRVLFVFTGCEDDAEALVNFRILFRGAGM